MVMVLCGGADICQGQGLVSCIVVVLYLARDLMGWIHFVLRFDINCP